jgi:hypothetical protein
MQPLGPTKAVVEAGQQRGDEEERGCPTNDLLLLANLFPAL